MVGEALGVEGGVLFTVTVDTLLETVGTVVEVALCVLGFIPAVEVERVMVVTTLEVTEVEEEEFVAGPEVDIGEVVSETIVENVLASEGMVTGEMVAKVDAVGLLFWVGVEAEVVEPLRAVVGELGTIDMVMVVAVSAIVVVVLNSIGVETEVVAPLIVVGVFDSVKIVIGVEPELVIDTVSGVVRMDTVVVVTERVVPELLSSVEIETDMVLSPIVVKEELALVEVVKRVLVSTGLVEDEPATVGLVTEEKLVEVVEDLRDSVEVITGVLVSLGVVEGEIRVVRSVFA